MAEGAFPALGGAPGTAPAGGTGVKSSGGGGGGVLSFDAQTKRVKVEAYRVMGAREEGVVDVVGGGDAVDDGGMALRVPPPPGEVQYLRVPRGPATRWAVSMDGQGGAKYVAPPPAPHGQTDHGAGRRRRRRGEKGKAGGA